MAKISNTTSYPFVQPSVDDYVIGTAPNANPANQTSNFKLGDIANLNPQDLQSVLTAGNIADLSIRLVNPSGGNELTLQSSNITGADFLQINTQNVNSDMEITAQRRLTLLGDVTTIQGGSSVRINSEPSVDIETEGTFTAVAGSGANAGTVVIGTDAPTQADTTRMEFGAGGIKVDSIMDFKADNGILLDAVVGAAGQVVTSQGPGAPLTWSSPIPSLSQNLIFAGDSQNVATPTDLIQVDIANSTVTISKANADLLTLNGPSVFEVIHPSNSTSVSVGLESFSDQSLVGLYNTGLGVIAGQRLTDTAAANTLVGYAAGATITTGTGNTCLGREADALATAERAVAIGARSVADSNSVALGTGAEAEEGCIALGDNANADRPGGVTGGINITAELINGLVTEGIVYPNNTDALAELNAGDVYLLDNNVIGIPEVGANNGPAIVCVVYEL